MNEDLRFCENPWTFCEIYVGGGVYVCCPAWNRNVLVGNIYTQTPQEIWNSYQAQQFRRGSLAMEAGAYKNAKIWDSAHPDSEAFVRVLTNPIFRRPIVTLSNVEAIMRAEQPPELHIDFKTGQISRVAASAA